MTGDNSIREPPVFINSLGERKDACFSKVKRYCFSKQIETTDGCPITWKNKFHLFGGSCFFNEIRRLDGHTIKDVGKITVVENSKYELRRGGCSVVNGETVFLCFRICLINNSD